MNLKLRHFPEERTFSVNLLTNYVKFLFEAKEWERNEFYVLYFSIVLFKAINLRMTCILLQSVIQSSRSYIERGDWAKFREERDWTKFFFCHG